VSRKLFFALGFAPLLLAGCGGTGGANSANAQHAVIDVAKAAHSYRYLTGMAQFHDEVLLGEPNGELRHDPVLGVDYRVTVGENGVFHAALSDPDDDQALGTVDIVVADTLPYPVTTRQVINASIDGSHMEGELDLTTQDEAGLSNELSGQYSLTNPATTAAFDLVTLNGAVSGTFEARVDDGDVVDFRDISVTQTFATNASFTAHGRDGTLTINPDGSGQSVAADDSGTYTVRWTADWIVTLVRPDGSSTNLGPISGL
jgi:hypothetical protein